MSDTSTQAVLAVAQAQQAAHTPHIPDTMPTAGEWMPADPAPSVWPSIREHIVDMVTHQPRSLQREIGPSELGTPCLYHLGQRLIGRKPVGTDIKWLPFIGTSVHAQFETLFGRQDDYETETRVQVGEIWPGRTVSGSIDLWDTKQRATIDWKIVGDRTLERARRYGPIQQYMIQASLYGIGMNNRYHDSIVRKSCIYYLPRNSQSIDDGYIYETQFDPAPGQWALARATLMLALIHHIQTTYGNETRDSWLECLKRDDVDCFACKDHRKAWHPDDDALINGFSYADWLTKHVEDAHKALPEEIRPLIDLPQADYQPTNTTINKGETK